MSLSLGVIVTAARDRHAGFFRSRVTDAVVARFLSDAQNELIGAAVRRDPQYLAQTATLAVSLNGSDAPGTAGAGTSGGVPGTVTDGALSLSESTTGSLIAANVTSQTGASPYVTGRVVTSASANTVTSTGAGRTVNGDATGTRIVVIVSGKGIGQRRTILSNTIDTWTISTGADGLQWATVPDTTSMFDVVEPTFSADDTLSVVTGLPATTSTTGYLIRTNAQGIPFIDYTQPIIATLEAGAALPSMQFPLDGTVWFADGESCPLQIIAASDRFSQTRFPAVYVVGQSIYLAGCAQDWQSVASIALRYTPIAPPFTALTDLFLIPDHARPVLVAKAAAFMAMRVAGMPDVVIDPAAHYAAAMQSEKQFLANVSAGKRGRGLHIREVW